MKVKLRIFRSKHMGLNSHNKLFKSGEITCQYGNNVTTGASSRVSVFWGGEVASWEGFGEFNRNFAKRPRMSDYASLIEPTALACGKYRMLQGSLFQT